MIDVNKVEYVIGIYTSVLYKDFYAVDFVLKQGDTVFKIRYPYKTKFAANAALQAIKNKQQQDLREPDYKPYVWIMVENKPRKR